MMSIRQRVPGTRRVLERNMLAYRRLWLIFVSGFFEPFLYLLSIGIGVGALVGKIPGPGGKLIDYRDFVAPGLMATAAMNGAIFDTTFMFFIKLKYWKTYDSMLSTPLTNTDVASGEIMWSVLRGGIYAMFFLLVMLLLGLLHSPLAVLALPTALLECWAFAAVGSAASSYMRSYWDFDFINVVLLPSFLFSGTFFPLDRYPGWLEVVVRCTPLYQAVALMRSLVFGHLDVSAAGHVVYLVVMGIVGLSIASRRLGHLLTP
ncbi:MAG: ABC transporter permease [Acidobacteria bacterium]|nr:ABC transporter permease [Acidobacteriota bacterium]